MESQFSRDSQPKKEVHWSQTYGTDYVLCSSTKYNSRHKTEFKGILGKEMPFELEMTRSK